MCFHHLNNLAQLRFPKSTSFLPSVVQLLSYFCFTTVHSVNYVIPHYKPVCDCKLPSEETLTQVSRTAVGFVIVG